MTSELLRRALHDNDDPVLRPLPAAVADLLVTVDAPPRLVAHLRLVHDVAIQLLTGLIDRFPQLAVDQEAVRFGAATHDVGKVVHPGELTGAGHRHELAGRDLLVLHGFPADLARFAATHADWDRAETTVEELLVSLADKIWKGRREIGLEQRLVEYLAQVGGQQPWEVFLALDDLLTRLAGGADMRLAHQTRFPAS